jgi:hypothetical protein
MDYDDWRRWIKWTKEDSQEVAPEWTRNRMDSMSLGGDNMDMTASSDDDVIAIYKN